MVTPNELLTAALRYAELGYRVFPCASGGKAPLTPRGFHDATTDPEQIEPWWSRHPNANIGLPTTGLLVIDIDGADNPWPGDPDLATDLANAGAIALTPRGGRHYLFRRPEGKSWKCSTGRLAPGVDIRTDGGYIVVAPSQTQQGAYRWALGLELDQSVDRLPEPPAWLVEALDRLTDLPACCGGSLRQAGAPGPSRNGTLPSDGNPIPQGQRNATLARLAGAMRRVGMGASEIAAALHQTNRVRCRPPLADREVDRIAESVSRYPPDEVSVALAEDHYAQMQEAQTQIQSAKDDVTDANTESDADISDPGPIPDELLHVPGFIDEVMQYTLDTAPYPEPVLAFAGALTLQALLAGRKVRDAMDNRTNLYVLSLANSGVGKDHARKVNARILYEAGLADCLGTSFASGEGIEDRLYIQPTTLFQVDEIDGLLTRVGQARDARHEAIVSILLQMYSSASSIYVMRAKAGQDRTVIDQPCLCLFGTAVPKHFYEALSARLMTNGFLARLLILECRGRGVGRDDTERPIPASILEAARWWADYRPGSAGNLSGWHPVPHRVPQTPDAEAVFRRSRERADAEYTRCEQANDPAGMAIWARAYEKIRRLALLHAVSACRDKPIITREAATWASRFTFYATSRMIYMMRYYAAEGEFDLRRRRLIEVLTRWRQQHGDAWMPFWLISRKLPWPPKDHEAIRHTLIQQQIIETQVVTHSRRGRPGLAYRLIPSTFKSTSL